MVSWSTSCVTYIVSLHVIRLLLTRCDDTRLCCMSLKVRMSYVGVTSPWFRVLKVTNLVSFPLVLVSIGSEVPHGKRGECVQCKCTLSHLHTHALDRRRRCSWLA